MIKSLLDPRGRFQVEHIRDGKKIATYDFPNGITNEGKNNLFDVHFDADTQITIWYTALIDNAGFTALAADDTYDDINQVGNGWSEFTSYTDANNADSALTRPVWPPDPASGQSITNSTTKGIFDITVGGTVKGVFVVGGGAASDTKDDHAADGTLWATALFNSGDVVVVNGDQLKITYTVSA